MGYFFVVLFFILGKLWKVGLPVKIHIFISTVKKKAVFSRFLFFLWYFCVDIFIWNSNQYWLYCRGVVTKIKKANLGDKIEIILNFIFFCWEKRFTLLRPCSFYSSSSRQATASKFKYIILANSLGMILQKVGWL